MASIESSVPAEVSGEASDLELMRDIARGDQEAFRTLLTKYAAYMRSILRLRLRNDSYAIEDRFLRAAHRIWTNAGSFDPSRSYSAKAWIAAITVHCASDFMRENKDITRTVTIDSSTPLEATSHALSIELRDAAGRIAPQYRKVLNLKYFWGYTVAEIGQMMDKSPKAVESLLRHAREQLGKELGWSD